MTTRPLHMVLTALFACISMSLSAQNDTIFHFSFDGNLNDVSGNNVLLEDTISASNDFWSVDSVGVHGNALALSGESNTHLTIQQEGLFEPVASDFTVCAWLKNKSALDKQFEHIVLHQKGGTGATRYYLAFIGNNTGVNLSDTLVAGSFVSGAAARGTMMLERDVWYHVAAVGKYQDSTISLYVDGVLDTVVKVNEFEASTGGFQVGRHQGGTNQKKLATWPGLIDDLYLISKALNEDELMAVAGLNNSSVLKPVELPINVYPNPTSDLLHVDLPNATSARIYIYSEIGQLVMDHSFYGGTTQLDLSNLPTGVYTLKLQAKNAQAIRKFIKQN
ncbi:LamG-like jellyroll fold domain-containing protein [Pontibacter sp. G13]|uniref:LamG-like jellyroll fold domain-containing protein n=1 Tax=Pontibacter sp. G13 TaxID=3074898 RepID=UPI00288A64CC|nr:LamG-like jellyroll fold domain-containing protein [Pontibacter sp. G13]WNJ20638.1 LamG-like jellyroll fold domain-containing protein [Pontibacter sp. G13]